MRRVDRGAFAAPTLNAALEGEPLESRRLVTDLVYGTLRHRHFLDACLAPQLRAPERLPAEVRNALRVGAYERLRRATPVHAAVHEWVATVKERQPRLAGLTNAVLRRVAVPSGLTAAERLSLPPWLHDALVEALGDDAEAAATAMLEPEPLWLSLYAADAVDTLLADGAEVTPGPFADTVALRSPRPLSALGAFRQGKVQPQNPASTLPGRLLAPSAGDRVLDLAGGHGVKAAALAAAGARVVSVEIDARKVERARRNLARLGLEVEHRIADLRDPPPLEPAPWVLLDAPCSGTGTLRGHPEIKLRLEPEGVRELARLQERMLSVAAGLVAPGGRLVYAVCALTREEGPERIARFLDAHPDFAADAVELPAAAPLHRAGPGAFVLPSGGLDGFYLARLQRT